MCCAPRTQQGPVCCSKPKRSVSPNPKQVRAGPAIVIKGSILSNSRREQHQNPRNRASVSIASKKKQMEKGSNVSLDSNGIVGVVNSKNSCSHNVLSKITLEMCWRPTCVHVRIPPTPLCVGGGGGTGLSSSLVRTSGSRTWLVHVTRAQCQLRRYPLPRTQPFRTLGAQPHPPPSPAQTPPHRCLHSPAPDNASVVPWWHGAAQYRALKARFLILPVRAESPYDGRVFTFR